MPDASGDFDEGMLVMLAGGFIGRGVGGLAVVVEKEGGYDDQGDDTQQHHVLLAMGDVLDQGFRDEHIYY